MKNWNLIPHWKSIKSQLCNKTTSGFNFIAWAESEMMQKTASEIINSLSNPWSEIKMLPTPKIILLSTVVTHIRGSNLFFSHSQQKFNNMSVTIMENKLYIATPVDNQNIGNWFCFDIGSHRFTADVEAFQVKSSQFKKFTFQNCYKTVMNYLGLHKIFIKLFKENATAIVD